MTYNITKSVKRITLIALSAAALATSSCKKYLDINTSPVTAASVDAKLLFGYAVVSWDANRCSGDSYIPIALMAQTIASGGNYGWGKTNLYSEENLSSFSLGNTWKVYYSTAGNNLQLAIKAATAANDKNTIAQCKIVLSQLMYECTTLYGDVPFSESWKDGIAYPKFDAQKDVLEGILTMLDESIAALDPASPLKISDYDIYYSGDISKWKKLALSLKLKVLLTMVDKDPSKATAIGQLVQSPASLIASSGESWLHKYSTTANQENPKYRLDALYGGGSNIFFFANRNVFDYMKPKNDPRIPKYFDKGTAADYLAVGTEEEADATTATISNYLYRKDAPDVLLSYQEILFIQAEVYARGLGVTKDLAKATTLYKQGVQAAMAFYQADATATTTYVNTQLADLSVAANPLREIQTQQWIDFMDRPLDAFIFWRRSGMAGNEFPVLTLPPGATAGPLIRRWPYSPDEAIANPNIPNPAPKYYDKQWFDL